MAGSFVSVEDLAQRIRTIDDPVLRGKVQKALHLLHRTLELYRSVCAARALGCFVALCCTSKCLDAAVHLVL